MNARTCSQNKIYISKEVLSKLQSERSINTTGAPYVFALLGNNDEITSYVRVPAASYGHCCYMTRVTKSTLRALKRGKNNIIAICQLGTHLPRDRHIENGNYGVSIKNGVRYLLWDMRKNIKLCFKFNVKSDKFIKYKIIPKSCSKKKNIKIKTNG